MSHGNRLLGLRFAGFALALWTIAWSIGCRPSEDASKPSESAAAKDKDKNKEQSDERPKPDFELLSLTTVPGDSGVAFPFMKPGHWFTMRHELRSNVFDFQGELWTSTLNSSGVPLNVENTEFQLRSVRAAPLPKTQVKLLDTTYYVPRSASDTSVGVWMGTDLKAAKGGRLVKEDRTKVYVMPPYQYFMLVLASDPDRYGYLKQLSAISTPSADNLDSDTWMYYRVIAPSTRRFVPLPSQSLTWSSLAYIVWDDLDPAMLTAAQQQALMDWLHWGGQLIISGPNSLERMRGRFLEAFLPADAGPSRTVGSDALTELNDQWSLASSKGGDQLALKPLANRGLASIALQRRPEGESLAGTSDLVMERRVGAGRIVVTSFSLTDRSVVNWPSFDSFFNGCLLRRPPRVFELKSQLADTRWADLHPALINDSRLSTTVRYFARDIGHLTSRSGESPDSRGSGETKSASRRPLPGPPREKSEPIPDDALNPREAGPHFSGYPSLSEGVAAWNDRSGAADAARRSLKDSAGISVPRGRFVLQVLVVYLALLVPVNWAVFRAMGRVEWAWFAAPVISIAAAVVVVRAAQLNIGFARSVTEVAVAEIQAGYRRAHLTRYTALYTSLSTSYEVEFDRADALLQPFGAATTRVASPSEMAKVLIARRDQKLRLQGFQVSSNSTSILHSEQMCDLGGSFALRGDDRLGYTLANETRFVARGVGVLARSLDGNLRVAWVGVLNPRSTAALTWQSANEGRIRFPQWDDAPATAGVESLAQRIVTQLDTNHDGSLAYHEAGQFQREIRQSDRDRDRMLSADELVQSRQLSTSGEVSLGQLVDLACQKLELARGDMRMIGWVEGTMPGMHVRPAAAQSKGRTLLLVHLQRGPMPRPLPDRNRKADVVKEVSDRAEISCSIPKQ